MHDSTYSSTSTRLLEIAIQVVSIQKFRKMYCSSEFTLISSLTCSLVTRPVSDCEDSAEEESYCQKKKIQPVLVSMFQ